MGPQRFDPAAKVTRAQYAALLEKLFLLPPPVTPAVFSDVQPGHGAYSAVQAVTPYLAAYGGRFHPDEPIDRETSAALLVRILNRRHGLAVLSPSAAQAVLARSPDAGQVNPALHSLVATAIERGAMVGMPDGSLVPKGSMSRAQVAVLLQRVQTEFINR